VQHGKAIKASIKIYDEWLSVSNTKSNIKPNQESLGTGLKNLEYRYTLLSDRKPIILNTADNFTIKIPIIQLSNDS